MEQCMWLAQKWQHQHTSLQFELQTQKDSNLLLQAGLSQLERELLLLKEQAESESAAAASAAAAAAASAAAHHQQQHQHHKQHHEYLMSEIEQLRRQEDVLRATAASAKVAAANAGTAEPIACVRHSDRGCFSIRVSIESTDKIKAPDVVLPRCSRESMAARAPAAACASRKIAA